MKVEIIVKIIATLVLSCLVSYQIYDLCRTVEVGETWIYKGYNCKNPYESDCLIEYNTVISVNDGFCQYVDEQGDTSSSSIRYFLIGSTLLEK